MIIMLHTISYRMAGRLAHHGVINCENLDVYVYGFELIFSFLFSTAVILMIGAIISRMIETLIFLSIFVILRSFTGGYHAKTYAKCAVVTYSTYLSVVLFSEYIPVSRVVYIAGLSIAALLIAFLAPIEHPNKRILPDKKIKHKITSLVICIFFSVLGLVIEDYNIAILRTIFFSIIADVILMFPCIFKKGELYG